MVARPMLGAVLDALTIPNAVLPPASHRLLSRNTEVQVKDVGVVVHRMGLVIIEPWITRDPAEAYELLQARDLVPLDYRGRFVCPTCGGLSWSDAWQTNFALGAKGLDVTVTNACDCIDGVVPHPTTMPDLIAWASLGFDGPDGILGREQHAAEMYPQHRVAWQVAAQSTFAMQADGAEFCFPSGALVAITIPPITTTA